jgi:hypothetical protein
MKGDFGMLDSVQLNIVRFCADECDRQQSGELSVARMVEAYEFADAVLSEGRPIDEYAMMKIAYIIDPRNKFTLNDNYRCTTVVFANGNEGANYFQVPRLMNQLFTEGVDMMRDDPEAWVKELLRIHPWVDGNGRCAAIMWNWLNGTMIDPVPYPQQEW